jgi:ubiquinone biosynthesis protein UbiJ
LNRNIAASTPGRSLAKRLEGTSLQVDVEGVTRIRAACNAGRLALLAGDDTAADAVISGSAPALLQLFRTGSAASAGSTQTGSAAQSKSSVQIRGDAEIANLYRELFTAARPDLEEELSRWVGDMPARHLSLLAKSVRTWARRARRTAGENIAEYLQEEGRDLVTKTEMEEFLRGVDGVRDGVDRIEARLRGIEQRVKGT